MLGAPQVEVNGNVGLELGGFETAAHSNQVVKQRDNCKHVGHGVAAHAGRRTVRWRYVRTTKV